VEGCQYGQEFQSAERQNVVGPQPKGGRVVRAVDGPSALPTGLAAVSSAKRRSSRRACGPIGDRGRPAGRGWPGPIAGSRVVQLAILDAATSLFPLVGRFADAADAESVLTSRETLVKQILGGVIRAWRRWGGRAAPPSYAGRSGHFSVVLPDAGRDERHKAIRVRKHRR